MAQRCRSPGDLVQKHRSDFTARLGRCSLCESPLSSGLDPVTPPTLIKCCAVLCRHELTLSLAQARQQLCGSKRQVDMCHAHSYHHVLPSGCTEGCARLCPHSAFAPLSLLGQQLTQVTRAFRTGEETGFLWGVPPTAWRELTLERQ